MAGNLERVNPFIPVMGSDLNRIIDAIDGLRSGVVTINTATSGARAVADNTGFTLFDTNNTKTFFADASTGNVTIGGGLTASSTLTGAQLIAGVVKAQVGVGTGTSPNVLTGFLLDTVNGLQFWTNTSNTPTFKVDMNGNLTATSATVSGTINASAGTFSGTITATGTISGGTLSGASITGGTIIIGTVSNQHFKADTNGIYLGNDTFASAPFRVDMTGALTATNATISGTITSSTIVGATIKTSATVDATHAGVLEDTTGIYGYDGTNVDHGSGVLGLAFKLKTDGTSFFYGTLGSAIVTTSSIVAGAVDTNALGATAVTTAKIANAAVTNAILATNSVATANIQNAAVGPTQISNVNASQLASTGTPATVTGVAATPGIQTVYLSWTPGSINDAYLYEVSEYVGTSVAATPATGSTTLPLSASTFMTLTGRTTGQAYTYWVRAKNYSGTFSAAYSTATTTTPVATATADIAAAAVTGPKIASATITGSLIANSTIVNANIVAGTITGASIASSTITGSNIFGGTVTTDKLTVGSFKDSAIANPSFEDVGGAAVAANWTAGWDAGITGGGSAARVTSQQQSGAASVGLTATNAQGYSIASDAIPVTPGDTWYVSAWYLANTATTSGVYFKVFYGTTQTFASGDAGVASTAVASNVAGATTWTQTNTIVTVPAGKTWMRLVPEVLTPNVTATIYFDSLEARKAVGTANIVNAAITNALIANLDAGKINAGTITGIAYNNGSGTFQVTAGGALTATSATITGTINANAGTFSGTITASGTISGGTLSGATITGGTIAIGSGNSIFKADSNGIYLGNATFASAPFRVDLNGNLTATSATITGTINASGGTFSGSITASGTISGGTISGANVYGANIATSSATGTTGGGTGFKLNGSNIDLYSQTTGATENLRFWFAPDAITAPTNVASITASKIFNNQTGLQVTAQNLTFAVAPGGALDLTDSPYTFTSFQFDNSGGTLSGGNQILLWGTSSSVAPMITVNNDLGVGPTVSVVGTPGTTTYTYQIVAVNFGDTLPSYPTTITNGNATLNSTNYNSLSWEGQTFDYKFKILRNGLLIDTIMNNSLGKSVNNTYLDKGNAGVAYTQKTYSTAGYIDVGAAFNDASVNKTGVFVGGNLEAYGGNLVTHQLVSPSPITVTPQGTTGATTYTYQVVAVNNLGDESVPSPAVTITNGNATLSSTNSNKIVWPIDNGSVTYRIIRTAGGATQGLIASASWNANTLYDSGLPATAYTPQTLHKGGIIYAGGGVRVPDALTGYSNGINFSTVPTMVGLYTLGSAASGWNITTLSNWITGASMGGFTHLALKLTMASDQATSAQPIYLRLNGDVTTNYGYEYFYQGSRFFGSTGSSNGQLGNIAGTNFASGARTEMWIYIPNFSSTTFYKQAFWNSTTSGASGTQGYAQYGTASFASTAAISSIAVQVFSGNIVAGSVMEIWGYPP